MPPKTVTKKKVVPSKSSKTKATTSKAKSVSKPPAQASTSAVPVKPVPEPPKKAILEKSIKLKQLATVVFDDEAGGKHPILLVETGGTQLASTFLRYRDVNYLNVMNSNEMESERIRKAILGGLRYGKPVVIDMDDVNLLPQIEEFANRVLPDLFQNILDWNITKSDYFTKLIKEGDESDYEYKGINTTYYDQNIERFRFIIYTRCDVPQGATESFFKVTVSN